MSAADPHASPGLALGANASSGALPAPDESREQRLVEVLDHYVAALEAGRAPHAAEVLAEHPDLAADLVECLEGVETIHRAVRLARPDEQDSDATIDSPLAPPSAPVPPHEAEAASDRPVAPAGEPSQIGDYLVRGEIGRGGMGVVYEAEERSLRRRVALKVLPFAAVLDQRQIARFRNEAQAAAQLHHPHIVPVFAIGQDRGVHYYAMQYIEGQSVAQAIDELRLDALRGSAQADSLAETLSTSHALAADKRASRPTSLSRGVAPASGHPLGSPTAVGITLAGASLGPSHRTDDFFKAVARLGADIADALHHAHEYGVVHRDVKPSNLLLDAAGKAWITDFGLARIQSDLGVTATGDLVGTLRYMSPEQARGRADQIDGRTDVYGLGATLYELLTLRHAHRGEHRQAVLDQIERVEPLRPRWLNSHIPADLESIVLRAMEKDRSTRYPNAEAMAEDLRRFLAGLPTIARPAGLTRRVSRWLTRRRKMVAGIAAASLVVAVVSLAGALGVWRAQQRTALALEEAQRQADRAETRFTQAREVVDRFGAALSDRLALLPGSEPLRRELLSDTLGYYQAFLDQAEHEPGLRESVLETRIKAAAAAERLGKTDEALKIYQQAISELREANPTDAARSWLALAAANRANLLASRGETTAALVAFDEAITVSRALLATGGTTVERTDQLAATLIAKASMLAGDEPDRAQELLLEAINMVSDAVAKTGADARMTRRLAVTHSTLSEVLRSSDPAAARRSASRAVNLLRELVAQRPELDPYRADLAMAYSNRAALAADRADLQAAAVAYESAVHELARLVDRAPMIPRHRSELAVAEANLALVLARRGEESRSDGWFDRADEHLKGLAEDFPTDTRHLRQRSALWNNRGVALRDRGRLDEAADAFGQSVRIEKRRLASLPQGAPTLLALHYANHAQVLSRLGRLDEAARAETLRRSVLTQSATEVVRQ
ncbi:protein kinase domain-containing protein [Botrimarina hoheduenensis]|uniref:Serine/threonine-protein kinase PrkC n=1 Tax=Botrimarina hoheduenensis TaxID=2528000 RepID=A0A5C5VZB0_9BACT|nr:serine/threonine-protein kinase [Botrimarina hoheduenensis]TWT43335.1 Serine/threonine-protein kinase PrkC [Botrimarina hoheduenensis]